MSATLIVHETPLRGPVCGCVALVNDGMRQRGENGIVAIHFATGGVLVHINRPDRAGRLPPFVSASFCPFCGKAYE